MSGDVDPFFPPSITRGFHVAAFDDGAREAATFWRTNDNAPTKKNIPENSQARLAIRLVIGFRIWLDPQIAGAIHVRKT